jgi:hypothetical protein
VGWSRRRSAGGVRVGVARPAVPDEVQRHRVVYGPEELVDADWLQEELRDARLEWRAAKSDLIIRPG